MKCDWLIKWFRESSTIEENNRNYYFCGYYWNIRRIERIFRKWKMLWIEQGDQDLALVSFIWENSRNTKKKHKKWQISTRILYFVWNCNFYIMLNNWHETEFSTDWLSLSILITFHSFKIINNTQQEKKI
jgi:hypothetical protein